MSDKSVAEKLQIKPGRSVLLMNPPASFEVLLGPLPEGVILLQEEKQADIIILYTLNQVELEAQLGQAKGLIRQGGMIWVAYYKGTAKVKTDIHRDSINAYARTLGMVGVAMISIDQDWSALRLKVEV